MRITRIAYVTLAALGLTLGGSYNLRAYEEEAVGEIGEAVKDQCYRYSWELPGACSTCKSETCAAGTYCCRIVRLD